MNATRLSQIEGGPAAAAEAAGLASRIVRAWAADRPFTVEDAIRENPDARGSRSVLVELAYEEFCRREERGEPVPASEFAKRFPEIERSLRRVLVIDGYCKRSDVRDILAGGPWPSVGDDVLGFRLLQEIGRGAESRVYLAEELEVGERLVVVKVGPGCEEAATLGRLDHPNVVPIFSARRDPETGFGVICMPYLGRATLDAVIELLDFEGDRRPEAAFGDAVLAVSSLPPKGDRPAPRGTLAEEVTRVGAALASALEHAHAVGVVHSDVKPSNVLVTPGGTPMLLDFNLARHPGSEPGRIGGTLAYMAPERLRCWPTAACEASPASDVYSLAVTLRELLTGEPPVAGIDFADPDAAARKLATARSQLPAALPRDLLEGHDRLGGILAESLSPDPKSRPSAAEVARRLSASAFQAPASRTVAGMSRRTAIAAAAVGFGGAATAGLWHALRPRDVAREWEAGLAALDAARFADGAVSFDAVLSMLPDEPVALAARGWCHLRAGEPRLAYPDLKAARSAAPGGPMDAMLGYCVLFLNGDFRTGRNLFGDAIERDFDTAAVRTDAGYCCLQLDDPDGARRHLETAVAHDPRCGYAYHVLALLDRVRAVETRTPPDLDLVRAARDLAPRSAGLYLDCACSFALACELGTGNPADVFAALDQAVSLGVDPARGPDKAARYHPRLRDREEYSKYVQAAGAAGRVSEPEVRFACVAPPIDEPRRFFAMPDHINRR